MYEGKNIHYSPADSKLLCSFSSKLCNQRRLNGYGFCVRHILEDPTAPFKRCAYVAKSSNQMCTQAIPKNEERRYCNNHMQVLGMLPKKERKKKEKQAGTPDIKPHLMNSGSVKAKFSLSKDSGGPAIKPVPSAGDPDDPYAFSDTGPSEGKSGGLSGGLPTTCDSVLGKSLQFGQGFVRSASDIGNTAGFGLTGGSTIAKYYPELAEKLEKMRAKPEPKTTTKNRARSSRTMNKLQTKIAQNKINEKLKKSQELSQTDSNSSPLQVSSPEQGAELEDSPSPGPDISPSAVHSFSPQSSVKTNFSKLTLPSYEQGQGTHDIPPLPHIDTSFLVTLAAQDNLGFQSSVNEAGLSDRLMAVHTPPRLPPPYPGSSTLSTSSSLASSDIPASAFSPHAHLNCVLESLSTSHSPQRTPVTQTGPSGPPSLSSISFASSHQRHTNLQTPTPPVFLSPASSSSYPSATSNYPFPSSGESTDSHLSSVKSLNNHISLTSPNVDIFSMLNINPKPLNVDPGSGLQSSHMFPSPNTLAAHLSLPPPPPYVPPAAPQKVIMTPQLAIPQSKMAATTSEGIASVSKTSVQHTKLHKLTGVVPENVAKRKLKSDFAVKFYSFYAKRKINNHCLVGPYLCSSDEDSEDDSLDMLPWQRDVFSASSDEEVEDDEELWNDVPMGMRPTKLSLLKTRLRRQWCQARKAHEINKMVQSNNNEATMALIHTVRDSAACAVRALWQIKHFKKSKRKLQRRVRKKKTCCHRNEKEGQCQNQCLPYANHCLKHITYNINQQLFDFCTAKFANNVQCCLPSFDLRHELPLCQEHAAKTDNYQKQLELENKKKPRKKSKPPALTRPPRKGKKKKKGRGMRVQNSVTQSQSAGLDSTLSDVDVTSIDTSKPEESGDVSSSATHHEKEPCGPLAQVPAPPPMTAVGFPVMTNETNNKNVVHNLDLVETLSPDFDKPFELPLEQASRLLDESDFQEVVNKMPFDALDLFGKNGEPESEVEHMTMDLTSASKARDALEKLLTGTMSEEESLEIAMLLAQNLQTDAELAQNTGMITEAISGSTAPGDARILPGAAGMGMDISMNPHLMITSGLEVGSVSDPVVMGMRASGLNDGTGLGVSHIAVRPSHHSSQQQVMHSHQVGIMQQLSLPMTSNMQRTYRQQDSVKMDSNTFHQIPQQALSSPATTASSSLEGIPSIFTTELNATYRSIDNLPRSHLLPDQKSGMNLNHVPGLESFSAPTAKTVIRQLPPAPHPVTSSVAGAAPQSLYSVSSHGYPSELVGPPASVTHMPPSQVGELSHHVVSLETSEASQGYSSPQTMTTQSRRESGVPYQNLSSQSSPNTLLSPSSPSPSSDLSETHSLSLASRSKRVKLATASKPQSVIPHPHQSQQHHLHQHLQQHVLQQQLRPQLLPQSSVQHILQATSPSQNRALTVPDTAKVIRTLDKHPPSPNPQVITKSSAAPIASSTHRLALLGMDTMQHHDSSKTNFSLSALMGGESTKIKLQTTNASLSDMNQTRMNITENLGFQQSVNLLVSTASSFSPTQSGPKTGSTIRYSLTAGNSLAPSSALTTTIRHNLLTGPSGPTTESILVTVRQPSPLESVPTTVRHTLPDTLTTPITLPSPPSIHLPPASLSQSASSHEAQDLNQQARLTQSSIGIPPLPQLHSDLQHSHWVPIDTGINNLHNGALAFVSSSTRTQLTNKLNPAGQVSVSNKQSNAAAEAARISALASAAGVPVVCSQVSLPGFVQGVPAATFKSSGSS